MRARVREGITRALKADTVMIDAAPEQPRSGRYGARAASPPPPRRRWPKETAVAWTAPAPRGQPAALSQSAMRAPISGPLSWRSRGSDRRLDGLGARPRSPPRTPARSGRQHGVVGAHGSGSAGRRRRAPRATRRPCAAPARPASARSGPGTRARPPWTPRWGTASVGGEDVRSGNSVARAALDDRRLRQVLDAVDESPKHCRLVAHRAVPGTTAVHDRRRRRRGRGARAAGRGPDRPAPVVADEGSTLADVEVLPAAPPRPVHVAVVGVPITGSTGLSERRTRRDPDVDPRCPRRAPAAAPGAKERPRRLAVPHHDGHAVPLVDVREPEAVYGWRKCGSYGKSGRPSEHLVGRADRVAGSRRVYRTSLQQRAKTACALRHRTWIAVGS